MTLFIISLTYMIGIRTPRELLEFRIRSQLQKMARIFKFLLNLVKLNYKQNFDDHGLQLNASVVLFRDII